MLKLSYSKERQKKEEEEVEKEESDVKCTVTYQLCGLDQITQPLCASVS